MKDARDARNALDEMVARSQTGPNTVTKDELQIMVNSVKSHLRDKAKVGEVHEEALWSQVRTAAAMVQNIRQHLSDLDMEEHLLTRAMGIATWVNSLQ